jgi:uncharacterized protein
VKVPRDYFAASSGASCYLLHPEESDIRLLDISLALSRIQRFGGHCKPGMTYSVAHHSVLVSLLVEQELGRPEDAMAGLLHAATEAYLGDMISPLKRLVPAYHVIESSWAMEIASIFDLETLTPPSVKEADVMSFEMERRWCINRGPLWDSWQGYDGPVPTWPITSMAAEASERMFLRRYWELSR